MKLYEKLDFLLKVTDTPNSAFGKYVSFDASYISRMRSGKRNIPTSDAFLKNTADFFAEHLENSYQRKIVCEIIGAGKAWPETRAAAKKLLYIWLSTTDESDKAPIDSRLAGFANPNSTNISPLDKPIPTYAKNDTTQFFYGDSGKREAVERFLLDVIQLDNPPPLLLYSNEEFNWMYDKPEFAKKWAMLLFSYIQKGGKIKIAHTISRASGEMMVALQKWIPIYMTGAVKPYFYPKILDRVFRKTMFIAEGHSAVLAFSIGEHTENAMNCLLHDKLAVEALTMEYTYFLDMCKPLMQMYDFTKKDQFLLALEIFNAANENMITVRTAPSFYTMPKAVADSITQRLHSSWPIKRREQATKSLAMILETGHTLTEVLHLPNPETIRQGKVYFPMCDLLDKPGLFYTVDEFKAHIENVILSLKTYENYHVVLSDAIPANQLVYVKEGVGVILVKSDFPNIAFTMSEQRMISAFWDYLEEIKGTASSREKVIARLTAFAEQL